MQSKYDYSYRESLQCPECHKDFVAHHRSKKYCSKECQTVRARKRQGTYREPLSRICETCSAPFTTTRTAQRCCSKKCTHTRYLKEWREANPVDYTKVTTGSVGAAGELLVASDLLMKGFHVFRSLSPSCPCDLAILQDGTLLRIEVTTAHWARGGKLQSPKKDNERYDVIAYIMRSSREIIYDPPL